MSIGLLLVPALESTLPGQGPDLTRYFLVCGALLVSTGGLAYLFRRFLAHRLRERASRRSLQVLDVLPLGTKQKVAVVRCYDRSFVLGVGDKEVHLIAELDEGDLVPHAAPSEPAEQDGTAERPEAPFDSQLAAQLEVTPERRAPWAGKGGILG